MMDDEREAQLMAKPGPRAAAAVGSSAPYQLGAPIELPDLLALPPDGRRYTRDQDGGLALMSPDPWSRHGTPLVLLARRLVRTLDRPWWVLHERGVAFPKIYDLRGNLLRESFLGPKSFEPDVSVFARRPTNVVGPHGHDFVASVGVRLVVEVLSPSTWPSDLGVGSADAVDRKRSYLESGVPEYWALNYAVDEPGCPLPPRSALFLTRAPGGRGWKEMPSRRGRVRSRAVEGLELDLEDFWRECDEVPEGD